MSRQREGPGCWAFIDLGGRLTLSKEAKSCAEKYLWSKENGTVGGMVDPSKHHCTLLLRLDSPAMKHALRAAAKKTEPFKLRAGELYVSKVGRLSNEYNENVFSVGLEMHCDGIADLKERFFKTLMDQGIEESLSETMSKHDPYHVSRTSDAHCSLAYIREEGAEEMLELNSGGKMLDDCQVDIVVDRIFLKEQGRLTEIPLLGKPGNKRKDRKASVQPFIPLGLRAIPYHILEAFVAKHGGDIDEEWSTADVVEKIIVPLTRSAKTSFAELDENWSTMGSCDYFVSHAWRYRFLDVIDCVRQHRARTNAKSPREVRYWLDIFCANQHNLFAPTEIPNLLDAIKRAKGLVAVLQPWDEPIALQRIWCLYELLGCTKLDVPLFVEIPTREHARFHKSLVSNFEGVRQSVGRIDSENAQATNQDDLKEIRKLIEGSVGYNGLNVLIKDKLRQWLLDAGLAHLAELVGTDPAVLNVSGFSLMKLNSDEVESILEFAHQLARMVGDIGALDVAERLYRSVLVHREELLGQDNYLTCSVANDLAFCLSKLGKAAVAEELLSEYIRHIEGLIEQVNGNDGEESTEAERKKLLALLFMMENNLAMCIGGQGSDRFQEALGIYERVLEGRNQLHGTEENKDSIATLNNIAWLMAKNGDQEGAQTLFERVYSFRSRVHGEKHPATLNAAQNLAQTLLRTGRVKDACEIMEQVCNLKLENMGSDNRSTKQAIRVLIRCLEASGDSKEISFWEAKLCE